MTFLADKRAELYDAAKDVCRADADTSVCRRRENAKAFELAALAYGIALQRYLGGRTE